ncbi:winged helix-turn-helix domain-containing protein [Streptomyces hydrogenans]|uniref:winged helix-turn-helix domain-containing protein n=1 Tax=Streptomyces hydrogenans TaxID=1873719 RepID=UPI0035D623EE
MPEVSPRGTYLLVSEALRKAIVAGEISDRLPSEGELVGAYGVSRNTIRRALKLLEAEDLLVSVPGAGWRVSFGGERRTLVEQMASLIQEDSLTIGDAYPSEAKLCKRFNASRTAVRRALAQLEGAGVLDTVHGKGRTVRALPAVPRQA